MPASGTYAQSTEYYTLPQALQSYVHSPHSHSPDYTFTAKYTLTLKLRDITTQHSSTIFKKN